MCSLTNTIVKTGERLQASVVQHCWGGGQEVARSVSYKCAKWDGN